MFFEFIQHLISLDIAWFIELFTGNLLWLFLIYALMHVFSKGKKVIFAAAVFCLNAWVWLDLQNATGVMFFGAGFLSVLYITKLALITIAETSPSISKRMIYINELQDMLLVVIFSLFIGGM